MALPGSLNDSRRAHQPRRIRSVVDDVLNSMAVVDDAGTSQLWSARGLVLADVNPNVEIRLRWEMMVMAPLGAGTPLDTRAILEWGEGTTCAVAAPTVRVQAQPSLAESTAGTPISIARIFPVEVCRPSLWRRRYRNRNSQPVKSAERPMAPPRAISEIVAERARQRFPRPRK